ncbi:MAG: hypothetical protein JW882_19570 [Deltaproteobacteria bacterium]|nr:hypothetical protein [Deltaproteobacteria bacterium]
MSDKEYIETTIKEAELYRKQSLLKQAKQKYETLLEFIEGHEHYSKDKKLINGIKSRIKVVNDNITEIDEADERPDLSQEVQDLISNLFSFSRNKDTAAIESAVALAKFGQYDKAVKELERLIKAGPLPLMAAMNLLRCDLSLASEEVAITRLKKWVARDELTKGDLRYLSNFLRDILDKKGVSHDIPAMDETDVESEKTPEQEDEVLPLSSVNIEITDGPFKGREMELEVSFQAGNAVSLILGADKKAMGDYFKPGLQLEKIQCCSPLAVFNSKGIVSGFGKIESGPKKGHYSLDLKIIAN